MQRAVIHISEGSGLAFRERVPYTILVHCLLHRICFTIYTRLTSNLWNERCSRADLGYTYRHLFRKDIFLCLGICAIMAAHPQSEYKRGCERTPSFTRKALLLSERCGNHKAQKVHSVASRLTYSWHNMIKPDKARPPIDTGHFDYSGPLSKSHVTRIDIITMTRTTNNTALKNLPLGLDEAVLSVMAAWPRII